MKEKSTETLGTLILLILIIILFPQILIILLAIAIPISFLQFYLKAD